MSSSPTTKKVDPFWVAIGASAGGLEAIKEFFKSVPKNTGMIWVVIQHLSPDYKSMMKELLSSSTEMQIRPAEDGVEPELDTIYLIMPNTNLRIGADGKFILEEQHRNYAKPNLPIDLFFESMAVHAGKRSIGVVLSGTGSDGTRGARLIREQGGFVICQSVESAAFDGMPKSIISNGLADVVDVASALPTHIMGFASHPLAQGQSADFEAAKGRSKQKPLDQLFLLLLDRFKVDFSSYKPATVGRRIERRIQKCRKSSLEDYVHFASSTPSEVEALYAELLIGVTSFFRDRDYYVETFKKLLAEYINKLKEPRPLRFWVAGCSSGEEAYTIAILFAEVCEELQSKAKLKIFATDIDGAALAKASSGEYPESIVNDLPGDLLSKYFVPHGDTYTISNKIREMVVFAKHDLLRDPPFTKIDFISCRNLLIYLNAGLQSQILNNFSFSLQDEGLLLLGTSETLGDMEASFETVDKRAKLFRLTNARAVKGNRGPLGSRAPGELLQQLYPRRPSAQMTQLEHTASDQLKVYQSLADAMGNSGVLPFSILVDTDHQVLRVLGTMPEAFRPVTGELQSEVTKLLIKELQVPVASGLSRAFRTGETIRFRNVAFQTKPAGEDKTSLVNLIIVPFSAGRSSSPNYALVILSRLDEAQSPEVLNWLESDQEVRGRIADIEHELQITRENLQATIEELETSNEELQATNEELLAANEELQSTNEELQSVNEELYTVNNEHHERLQVLSKMRGDFSLLLEARNMSVLYLNSDAEILSFTPGAVRVFNLLEQDVGRPIAHISNQIEDLDVGAAVAEVVKSEKHFDQVVKLRHNDTYRITIHSQTEPGSNEQQCILILEKMEQAVVQK